MKTNTVRDPPHRVEWVTGTTKNLLLCGAGDQEHGDYATPVQMRGTVGSADRRAPQVISEDGYPAVTLLSYLLPWSLPPHAPVPRTFEDIISFHYE